MENWDHIEAVQRMQDYIVSHIEENITMEELSIASGYSVFHAIRLFKEFTGKTPFEYLRALKLTEAAKQIRDSSDKVIDTALDTNYDSHDGFTRAFSKQFQITPGKYKKEKPPVSFFTYYPISHYYFYHEKRSDLLMKKEKVSGTVTVMEVTRPARKLIVLRSKKGSDYWSYCEEMGCEWEGFMNSIAEKFDNAALIQLPQKYRTLGTSEFASGIEVPMAYDKQIPEAYEVIELEPCKMLYFQGMPYENEEDFCIAIEIVSEAVKNYKPEVYGYQWDYDRAPAFNFGANAKSGAKMAVPVKNR